MYNYNITYTNGSHRIEVYSFGSPLLQCIYANVDTYAMGQIVSYNAHPNYSYTHLIEEVPDHSLEITLLRHQLEELTLQFKKVSEAAELGLKPSDMDFIKEDLQLDTDGT
jgi:hypothetical protein